MEIKIGENMNLSVFFDKNLFDAGTDLFNYLNIRLNSSTTISLDLKDVLKKHFKAKEIFSDVTETYFLGLVDDSVFDMLQTPLSFQEADKKINNDYNGLMVFAVRLNDNKKTLTRSDIADLTRAFNRASQFMPVVLLVKYGNFLTFSTSERLKYQQTWRPGEKIGKVSMLKDINLLKTHAGHSRILEDLIKKPEVKNFNGLYEQWKEVFNIKILNKNFFKELADWYFWAVENVQFPEHAEKDKDGKDSISVIRLLTRLIFVWFMKEKEELIPDDLFRKDKIYSYIKDLSDNESTYYKAVLQNLFFATLNTPIEERKFRTEKRGYSGYNEDFGNHYVYRYNNLFKPNADWKTLFKEIPFLNGGIFDCLDDKKNKKYRDGFSDTSKNQSVVPNVLFFGEKKTDKDYEIDLNKIYSTSKQKHEISGIINMLNGYKFTISENTPLEEEIALDPNLLGKTFESLLTYYNPETGQNARKRQGSYYTPAEIVEYMVNESLTTYLEHSLKETCPKAENIQEKLRHLFDYGISENP
ncbi:MAG: hypothetical protein BWK80_18755, partial [Desulfobacteraceae bacterium IS3]